MPKIELAPHGELRDSTSINQLINEVRPDFVFHLRTKFPKTSFTAPEDTLDINVQGTFRVLEALRQFA